MATKTLPGPWHVPARIEIAAAPVYAYRETRPVAASRITTIRRVAPGNARLDDVACQPIAIAVFGAQCVGKTSLAEGLAQRLTWPVFSRDPLMATLLDAGVPMQPTDAIQGVGVIGIALQNTLLERHLSLGLSVVLECVAHPPIRNHWRELATKHGARFLSIRCVCSDRALHQQRFEHRQVSRSARSDRWGAAAAEMTWEYVDGRARMFDADTDADITVDAVRPLDENLTTVIRHIRSASTSLAPT